MIDFGKAFERKVVRERGPCGDFLHGLPDHRCDLTVSADSKPGLVVCALCKAEASWSCDCGTALHKLCLREFHSGCPTCGAREDYYDFPSPAEIRTTLAEIEKEKLARQLAFDQSMGNVLACVLVTAAGITVLGLTRHLLRWLGAL